MTVGGHLGVVGGHLGRLVGPQAPVPSSCKRQQKKIWGTACQVGKYPANPGLGFCDGINPDQVEVPSRPINRLRSSRFPTLSPIYFCITRIYLVLFCNGFTS
jgi:hypothetical protein